MVGFWQGKIQAVPFADVFAAKKEFLWEDYNLAGILAI
jgi:hypothetical protein